MPCREDIDQFCSHEMNKVHDDDESLHGAVINCLKIEYLKGEKTVSNSTLCFTDCCAFIYFFGGPNAYTGF